MRTIINTRFISTEAQMRLEQIMRENPSISELLDYDKSSGIVLIDVNSKRFIEDLIMQLGGRHPMALVVCSGSEDEKIVRRVYEGLSESDKTHVEIIPAEIGCRVSIFIDQCRDDIQAKFWAALYPDGPITDRARGGRTREFPEISVKLPKELLSTAMEHGKWGQMVVREDGVYVTEEQFRYLQEMTRKSRKDNYRRASRDPRIR